MSEVVEKPDDGKTSRLKKLTSGSTWVSPFRSSGPKKNLHKQLQDDSSISKVQVPRKFASHPTLDAQKKKKAEEKRKAAAAAKEAANAEKNGESAEQAAETAENVPETAENDAESPEEEAVVPKEEAAVVDASTKSLKDEPIDTPREIESVIEDEKANDVESERPLEEVEEPVEADNATTEFEPELKGDDDIEQLVKENPIELVTQPETKYVPVELPNQEILDKLKDKPNLLGRYQALNAAAVGSLSQTVDDPNKVINLGSGLRMTQQQLLDIAAKRVAPVLATINDEVSKTRHEDEIKRQDAIKSKVDAHQKKLQTDYEKHVQRIEKHRAKYDADTEKQLADLGRIMANNKLTSETFEATTLEEIETAKKDYETRELNAVEKHETDKETLIKNHEELVATKKQELEDSKTNQETTTKDIETLQERKVELDNENSELNTKVEDLTNVVNEKLEALESLKVRLAEKREGIANNKSKKETLVAGITTSKEAVSTKRASADKLSAEVGALAGVLSAYAAKLAFLGDDKKDRQNRLSKAKETYSSWEKEKQDTAKAVALEHERKRAEALEAAETAKIEAEAERQRLKEEAETRRVQEELEQQRLAEEQEKEEQAAKAEAERKAKEEEEKAKADAENEENLAKQQAEWEAQQQREYHEKMKNDPEYLRSLRVKEREEEQARLLEEQENSEALYHQRKEKEQQEAIRLQQEIEDLKNQQHAKAEEERLEAERIAQSKLEEIEKLKQEHDAKLALFKQRLEFEELQKARLLEEVENLKKIRELREEKARLALEVNKNSSLEDVQKLIEEREIEVARLTKQIEYDDRDLRSTAADVGKSGSFLGTSNDLPATAGKGASSTAKRSDKPQSTDNKKSASTIAAIGAASAAGAAGAVGAIGATASSAAGAVGSSNPISAPSAPQAHSANKKPSPAAKKESSSRKGSLTRFKDWTKKLSSEKPTEKTAAEHDLKKAKKTEVVVPVASTSKTTAPTATIPSDVADNDSEYETYSVYEEVTDGEFENNQEDPDYFEVSSDEFRKHLEKIH